MDNLRKLPYVHTLDLSEWAYLYTAYRRGMFEFIVSPEGKRIGVAYEDRFSVDGQKTIDGLLERAGAWV